ncbi:MAG: 2-oxo acid dehydrogenase subunit E2 [Candidatus Sungbacteria bacterium]|nr:2-oxo acid dehydrogenase subunit E2 [Candidatus Sungbacteria bacterium]
MTIKFGFFVSAGGSGEYGGLTEAEIKEWYVKPGDAVKKGSLLCAVESDKASFDVEAICDGIIKTLNYEAGEKWQRGPEEETPYGALLLPELGTFDPLEENAKNMNVLPLSATTKPIEKEARKPLITALARRKIDEHNISFDELKKVFPEKDRIEAEDVDRYMELCGKLQELAEQLSGQTTEAKSEQMKKKSEPTEEELMAAEERMRERINVHVQKTLARAVPAARKRAEELGVWLGDVVGTGSDGLITVQDVENKAAEQEKGIPSLPTNAPMSRLIHPSFENAELIETPTPLRKAIARNLKLSKDNIPHAGDEVVVDMTRLVQKHNAIKKIWEKAFTAELKYDHYIMYFVAQNILRPEFKILNAYWDINDPANPKIVCIPHVNLGIAVKTSDGLIVPVVQEAEKLGFPELARKVNEQVKKTIERKLMPADYHNLSVTVNRAAYFDATFGEIIGGERPEPIIPYTTGINGERSTTLILAFGKMQEQNGKHLLRIVFRFDHRIVDISPPLPFVWKLKQFLEKDIFELF